MTPFLVDVSPNSVLYEKPSLAQDQTLAAVAQLWPRFKGTVLGRVEVVEQALSAVLEGDLTDELRL